MPNSLSIEQPTTRVLSPPDRTTVPPELALIALCRTIKPWPGQDRDWKAVRIEVRVHTCTPKQTRARKRGLDFGIRNHALQCCGYLYEYVPFPCLCSPVRFSDLLLSRHYPGFQVCPLLARATSSVSTFPTSQHSSCFVSAYHLIRLHVMRFVKMYLHCSSCSCAIFGFCHVLPASSYIPHSQTECIWYQGLPSACNLDFRVKPS